MKHLGDICKINGSSVPAVDCIIGGSPCQDLSVAGLRKGIQHEELGDGETTRSGLFMEQIRIIKEMRYANRGSNGVIRPVRYGLWENVPGALSSPGGNRKGQDFRCVLEEFARVAEPGVSIPLPKDGKWKNAGAIIGNGWSLAWRIMDAQFWGVPQRRRRICLLCDFDGYTAPDIVFEQIECGGGTVNSDRESSVGHLGAESRPEIQPVSESLQGHSQPCGEEREKVTADAKGGIGTGNLALTISENLSRDIESCRAERESLAGDDKRGIGASDTVAIEGNGSRPIHRGDGYAVTDKSYTLNTTEVHGVAYTLQDREGKPGGGKGALITEDVANCLRTNNYQTIFQPVGVDIYNGEITGDIVSTITAGGNTSTGTSPKIAISTYSVDLGGGKYEQIVLNDQGGDRMDITDDKTSTLRAQANHPPIVVIEDK